MLPKITVFIVSLFLGVSFTNAQELWSLEKCIQYAQENSLSIKQAQYSIQNAELLKKQAQFNRLPNLTGQFTGGYQFGRTIDPRTNDFVSQSIGFNRYSVDAGMTVFNGNNINNSIRQSKIDLRAAQLDARAAANDISLNIASAYLNILLAEEQLENARARIRLSREQLSQTEKLIRAGSVPANDRLDFEAQIANDEQVVIEAENLVAINYLTLKQIMELDPLTELRIVRPEVVIPADANPDQYTLAQVYSAALGTQPQIEANELRLQSAQLEEQLAKTGLYPRLSLWGQLNSNYSSIAQNPIFETRLVGQEVFIDDQAVFFEIEDDVVVAAEDINYLDQLNENFGQAFGVSISVPIYNNHSNRIAMQRTRIQSLNVGVTNQQAKQQLKTDIQNAIANAKASKRYHEASQRSLVAAQGAFENAQKRFDLGAINSLEFTTARNNLDQAQVEVTRAKFQYVFNLKIVDFYLGKELQLK